MTPQEKVTQGSTKTGYLIRDLDGKERFTDEPPKPGETVVEKVQIRCVHRKYIDPETGEEKESKTCF
jgi:hypothetical protein